MIHYLSISFSNSDDRFDSSRSILRGRINEIHVPLRATCERSHQTELWCDLNPRRPEATKRGTSRWQPRPQRPKNLLSITYVIKPENRQLNSTKRRYLWMRFYDVRIIYFKIANREMVTILPWNATPGRTQRKHFVFFEYFKRSRVKITSL